MGDEIFLKVARVKYRATFVVCIGPLVASLYTWLAMDNETWRDRLPFAVASFVWIILVDQITKWYCRRLLKKHPLYFLVALENALGKKGR